MTEPLLHVSDLSKSFPIRRDLIGRPTRWVRAVKNVSFDIRPGETLGLVGESGSGKSTVARLVLRLIAADSGLVRLGGRSVLDAGSAELRKIRQDAQMVFQDPYSSLDPTKTIGSSIAEPLLVHHGMSSAERRGRVGELLEAVGLVRDVHDRYPGEFSGGQRQRIAIARALALVPKLIVADEAVSALDVSTQAQILNLMAGLRDRENLAYLFISHDLHVVRWISDRIAVLYLGQLVELGSAEDVCDAPIHPYTQALTAAVLHVSADGPRRRAAPMGEIPSPANPPPGCPFHTRCPIADKHCAAVQPALREIAPGRLAACHKAG